MTLKVTGNGDVIVLAGLSVSEKRIAEFVESNSRWIERTKRRMLESKEVKSELDDERFLMLHGVKYPIEYILGDGKPFVEEDRIAVFYKDSKAEARSRFFTEYAKEYLTKRFEELSGGICPVKIKKVRGYFGIFHRDARGMYIALNERIVHAREEVSDMIIYHELTHIKHSGHGREFYRELSRLCPDHKMLRKELNATVKL